MTGGGDTPEEEGWWYGDWVLNDCMGFWYGGGVWEGMLGD